MIQYSCAAYGDLKLFSRQFADTQRIAAAQPANYGFIKGVTCHPDGLRSHHVRKAHYCDFRRAAADIADH